MVVNTQVTQISSSEEIKAFLGKMQVKEAFSYVTHTTLYLCLCSFGLWRLKGLSHTVLPSFPIYVYCKYFFNSVAGLLRK